MVAYHCDCNSKCAGRLEEYCLSKAEGVQHANSLQRKTALLAQAVITIYKIIEALINISLCEDN